MKLATFFDGREKPGVMVSGTELEVERIGTLVNRIVREPEGFLSA